MSALFSGLERRQFVVSGETLNCGHCLPRTQPEEIAPELETFLH